MAGRSRPGSRARRRIRRRGAGAVGQLGRRRVRPRRRRRALLRPGGAPHAALRTDRTTGYAGRSTSPAHHRGTGGDPGPDRWQPLEPDLDADVLVVATTDHHFERVRSAARPSSCAHPPSAPPNSWSGTATVSPTAYSIEGSLAARSTFVISSPSGRHSIRDRTARRAACDRSRSCPPAAIDDRPVTERRRHHERAEHANSISMRS